MAKKRMFAMSIIDSDAFLDMPSTAQNLYFHLNMRADDDGFIGNARRIMRDVRATEDDLKILLAKSFLIEFDGSVYVIKHWWLHNTLRSDRYVATTYTDEKSMLTVKENKAYTLSGNQMATKWQPLGNADIDKDIDIDKVYINNNIYNVTIAEIIEYLNLKLNSKYTTKNKQTNKHIKARIDEGHTVEEFKTVIDNMVAKWGNDTKMSQYLRPETLFGNKFESYLNLKVVTQEQSNTNKWLQMWEDA